MSTGISSESPPDRDENRQLKLEQLQLLYEAMPLSTLATLINAIALVAVEWKVTDHTLTLAWLAVISLITLARYALTLAFQRRKYDMEKAICWERCFTVGSAAAGVAWGSAAFLLFPENSIAHQTFLALIVGGMCAGAATTLSPSLLPILSFLLLALPPLIIRFLMAGSEITTVMGAMLTLFLVMITASSLRIHRNTRQNIELRINSEQQERVIAEKTAEQRAILDNAPVGIWLVGVDGRYRFVNRTFCDALDIREEEFLATPRLADLLGEAAAASCLESDRQCFETEGPQLSHETLTLVDGKEHLMEITKAKVRDHEGNITGAIGIAIDITEKQAAEENLRKLSQAVEQAGESIIITDRYGTIEYMNPSFTRITGYTPEEVMGKNPRILKSGSQSSEYYERLWETITSGEVWHSTVIDRRKDGNLYPALMTISPILDNQGEITHYVGIQQDMTEHNILEEQFRQAQKMEALGTLVGGIAHDFNNILTGISGNITLAKFEAEQHPEVVAKLEVAEDLSFKAADMIKQLMVFSRKSLIEMKPFGLTSFIETTSDLIKTTIPENISFHCELCPDELVVKGDSTQIQQVLLNLLNNARDAVIASNEPEISLAIEEFMADEDFISSHPDTDTRLFAHLIVRDNGCGIGKADMQHIFEPFFTTKEVGLGTGLGLSMAYGAIRNHRGIMEVESKPGSGTAFHIYLPMLEEKKVEIAPKADTEAISGNGELILVVDDNADVRSTVKNILIELNYTVLEAGDGLEAVELFTSRQDEIDIILMDVVMPRLGGVKAFERIKSIRPDIKVVFTTGYDRDDALKKEMPASEFSIIAKPFNIANLSHTIRQKLDS